MSKILILANSSSGLYGFRNELVLKLLEQYEVFVSLPDDTNNKELSKEGCIIKKIQINRRGMNPIQDIGLYRSYKKLLKEIKPDIVLTYTIKPNVYGGFACRRTKIPYLSNITGLGSALENGGLLQKVALMLYRVGLKKAECVFLQNKSNQTFFREHRITRAKQILLPGSGVNLNKFNVKSLPADRMDRTKEYCAEFIYISRVMKEKGIEEYLQTAKVIHKKYPNTRFHILGNCEESYEERLKMETLAGNIVYHGSVLDVRPYLYSIHCLIHPSFYPEGMSNVCLEAAASGRPVITTTRPGCRETVENGITGFWVPERDAQSLIDMVEHFLSLSYDQKKEMGLAGRKRMEDMFDRNIITNAYNDEIKLLLNR